MKQLRSSPLHQCLLLLLILKFPGVTAQNSPYAPDVNNEASLIKEHVEVFTDRSMYIVNEHINFRADIVTEGLPEGRAWSSVLYVELVSAGGSNLARAKFELSDKMCYGMLHIPSSALTGNYFLKCYTRWMRNSEPDYYSYIPLKIINPFRPEVAMQTREGEKGIPFSHRKYTTALLECAILDTSYERGEEISFRLSLAANTLLQKMHCCITVVPLEAVDVLKGQLILSDGFVDRNKFVVQFLPDLSGPSISGAVIRTDKDNEPRPNTRLHFSFLGDKPNYFVSETDAYGKFVVSIPSRTGIQEIFVTPEISLDEVVEVKIDQDFDAAYPALPDVPFTLSAGERVLATQMARRMQLSEAFNRSDIPEVAKLDTPIPFYGKAIHSIELEDFIDLPTLEEVFINLVPTVFVTKGRNRTTLKIHGDNSAMNYFNPLIMIDQIPVFDPDKLMSIPPKKISRIDVINDIYVKGSVNYGGIIHITTRESDMAGIDLSDGAYFFDYLALQPVNTAIVGPPVPGDKVPDTRNTLLWIADLVLERGSATDINFKAPAYPGEYVILVRSMTGPGEILSTTARFDVK